MRKKITQLAKGIMEEHLPQIRVLTAPIRETVLCGQTFRGTLSFESENGVPYRGLLYADDEHVIPDETSFSGSSTTLGFSVDATSIEDNREIRGRFTLVTNGGDVELPYQFSVCRPILLKDEMPADVSALAKFAEEKPDVLLHWFESEQFSKSPVLEDDSIRVLYENLKDVPDKRQALEEFLVACGAKQRVSFELENTELSFVLYDRDASGELILLQKGEGYGAIVLQCEEPFLVFAKTRYTSEDFKARECRVPFRILKDRLHPGKNSAVLRVYMGGTCTELPVSALLAVQPSLEQRREKQLRRAKLQLYRLLTTLYSHDEKPSKAQLTQLIRLLDSCDAFSRPTSKSQLLRAEVYRRLELREEEKKILEEIRPNVQRARFEDMNAYLWFLYLEEEYDKGNHMADGFSRLLHRQKDGDYDAASVFSLQLRSEPEWTEQSERALGIIRSFFKQGRMNTLLWLDACRMYNQHPELVQSLDEFERYVFLYGARSGMISEKLAGVIAGFIGRKREAHPSYTRLMRLLYEQYPTREILYAYLGTLLRSGEPREQDHALYVKGIEEDIRLTELFEYYLCTLPAGFKGEIPQFVLLYFTYNSPQRVKARLALYGYILKRYPPESEMYRAYEQQMQNFALDELLSGAVSDAHAPLYERMFIPEVLQRRTADRLTPLLFTLHISFENSNITEVMVLYGELAKPWRYPVVDGEAYVPLFEKDYRILFVDSFGNRFARTPASKRRFMRADDKLISVCRAFCPDQMPFRLALCRRCAAGDLNKKEDRELIRRCIAWEELAQAYRERLILTLIHSSADDGEDALPLLKTIKDSPYLDRSAAKILTETFIARGEDALAIEMVRRLGPQNFDPELILDLVSRRVRKTKNTTDKALYELALSLYRDGYADSWTLTYLCHLFVGPTADMLKLLQKAGENDATPGELPERLLAQMLFTECRDGLDESCRLYVKETPRQDRTLMQAYAMVRSDSYFRGEEIPEEVFAYLSEWLESEKKAEYLPLIGRLALGKYFSKALELKPEQQLMAGKILRNLYDQGLIFPFEQALGRFVELPVELADKTLIEVHTDSRDASVELGVRILPRDEGREPVYSEMPYMAGGYYVKALVLFTGETLEYRATLVEGNNRRVIREGTVAGGPPVQAPQDRYRRLCRLQALSTEDEGIFRGEMETFAKEDVVLASYFDCAGNERSAG